jgi:nitroreductase
MSQTELDHRLSFLFERRSIRRYTDQDISDETIELLLQAAMSAPSAVAKDPWRFVIIRKRQTREDIAAGLPNGKMLAEAPVGIIVCGDRKAAHKSEEGYMVQDCIAALENLLLGAHALGLGCCWLGVYPNEDRQTHIAGILGLPQGTEAVAAIALGYPAESKSPRTRYRAEYVHQETW